MNHERTADAPEFLPDVDDRLQQEQHRDRMMQEQECARILRKLNSMRHRGQIGRNVISYEELQTLARALDVKL